MNPHGCAPIGPGINIVIPALDEWPNLQTLLPRIHETMISHRYTDYEVIVVLEARADDEDLARIERLVARGIRRQPSDTFGSAVRSGIQAVQPSRGVTVFMDADGSHDPATIPALIASAEDHDVVIASRYVQGGSSANGMVLRTMSRTLNLAYRLILGIDCHDVSTSFKAYKTDDLKNLTLKCAHFDIVEEILVRLSQRKAPESLHIKEIPDHFHSRVHGESKRNLGPFIVSYLWTLYRLRRDQQYM